MVLRPGRRVWLAGGVRLLTAATVAAGAAVALLGTLSPHLHVTTDVVGYPIVRNFNINRYFDVYYLAILFFPLATWALHVALGRIFRSHAIATPSDGLGEPVATQVRWKAAAGQIARLVLVGGLFGVGLGIARSGAGAGFWEACLGAAATYASVPVLAARVSRLRGAGISPATWAATQNALAAPWLLVALYAVSEATRVTVSSTGATRAFPWLPGWLAATVAVGLTVAIVVRLRSASGIESLRRLERRVVLLVAGPVAVFLLHATLPGPIGNFDAFHDGEALVAATLVRDGRFPWRDIIFIHGILYDVVRPLSGLLLFEPSRWGVEAAEAVLWRPAYFVTLFFLHAYLFRRNWVFIVLTVALASGGLMAQPHLRFLLQPLALLLLAAVLEVPSATRMFAFTALIVLQALVVPETTYAVVTGGAVVIAFEATHARRGRPLVVSFRRTLLGVAFGSTLAAAWSTYLWRQGALAGFIDYYRTFVPDHHLSGGIPVTWSVQAMPPFAFAVVAPVACVLVAIAYVGVRVHQRRPLEIDDWVMGAAALLWALYYPKFLARADGHVYQVLFAAPSLLYFVVYRVVALLDAATTRGRLLGRITAHPVTLALLVAVFAASPTGPLAQLRALPGRLHATVPEPPRLAKLGYTTPAAVDFTAYAAVEELFAKWVRPDDRVFDFSNQPGVLYYLLDRRPATRFYHISMATREVVQRQVVRELERERPEVVLFHNDLFGLWSWDGISNMVRHYVVSQYLLTHYRPWIAAHGFVLLARPDVVRTRGLGPGADQVYFRTPPCDWGYAPSFLRLTETPSGPAESLRFESAAAPGARTVSIRGWAADPTAHAPAIAVYIVRSGAVLATLPVGRMRPDVAQAFGDPALAASGFDDEVTLPGHPNPVRPRELTAFALSADGALSELTWSAGSPVRGHAAGTVTSLELGERGTVRVTPQRVAGFVEVGHPVAWYVTTIDIPRVLRGSALGLLEIEADRWQKDRFALSDLAGATDVSRQITFRSQGNPRVPFRLPVGACSQWYGYDGERLYLRHTRPQSFSAIRLRAGPLDPADVAAGG